MLKGLGWDNLIFNTVLNHPERLSDPRKKKFESGYSSGQKDSNPSNPDQSTGWSRESRQQ